VFPITAADVIHRGPGLVKKDAISGFINEIMDAYRRIVVIHRGQNRAVRRPVLPPVVVEASPKRTSRHLAGRAQANHAAERESSPVKKSTADEPMVRESSQQRPQPPRRGEGLPPMFPAPANAKGPLKVISIP
jgi:hypothetical protein